MKLTRLGYEAGVQHKRAALLVVLSGVVLAAIAFSPTRFGFQQFAAQQNSTAKEKSKSVTAPAAESKPAKASPSEFARRIEQQIAESEFASARWGISVISLADGAPVYEFNADKLFTPASNMKIYTTGVALDVLGADYRWRTSVYANGPAAAGGTIRGDLVLYGRGAPDLVASSKDESRGSLAKLADDLHARGVSRVEGNVIGDESYFRGDPLGDGWQWTDLQWYFGAEASALTVNGNEVDVNLVPSNKDGQPPEVKVSDNQGQVTIQNRMAAGTREARPTIGLHRGLSDNNIEVWGEFAPSTKGFGARLSVHNPALWAAKLFVAALKARGIVVSGEAQSRNSRMPPDQRFDPAKAFEIAFVTSQSLSEIVKRTNKESNNLYAELILRTLGRQRGEIANLPAAPGRERGDDEIGLAVIRTWLARSGISDGRLALHDGSGLSRLDLVTPDSTTRLLLAYSKMSSREIFRQSLPVAGRDGTLGGRLKSLSDRVVAKTGSLTYDNSLSGYLTTDRGELLTFSIFCNDQTSRGDSSRLIDQIVGLLAAFPDVPPENPRKTK